MQFTWDEAKGKANKKAHGVSFEEASQIFDDPLHVSVLDHRFDYFEERWITIGHSNSGRILVAGHLYSLAADGEETIRIITAREATKKERERYENLERR